MSKELEAFNEIIDKFAEQIMRANKEELTATNKTNAIKYLYRTPQVRLLNEALQRLEAIDNANPSEALECLRQIGVIETYHREDGTLLKDSIMFKSEYDTIKQALLKAQEQKKVLDIIKKKVTNLVCIDDDCVWDNELYCSNKLTKEESDLLKRYLK